MNYLLISIVIGVFVIISGWAIQSSKEENAAWKEILEKSRKLTKDWEKQQSQINKLSRELETAVGTAAIQAEINKQLSADIGKLEAYAKRPQTLELKPIKISLDTNTIKVVGRLGALPVKNITPNEPPSKKKTTSKKKPNTSSAIRKKVRSMTH